MTKNEKSVFQELQKTTNGMKCRDCVFLELHINHKTHCSLDSPVIERCQRMIKILNLLP